MTHAHDPQSLPSHAVQDVFQIPQHCKVIVVTCACATKDTQQWPCNIEVSGKHPKQHGTEETVDRVRESFSRSPRK